MGGKPPKTGGDKRVCKHCSTTFVSAHWKQKFCTPVCRRADETARRLVKPHRKCENPECEVMVDPSKGKRYCSAKCRKHGEYLRLKQRRVGTPKTRTCKAEGCFKSFVADRNRNYCSDECRRATHNSRQRYVETELPQCAAEGCANPAKNRRAKYCVDCHKPLRVLAHRECVECGKPFEATGRRHICCSKACSQRRTYRRRRRAKRQMCARPGCPNQFAPKNGQEYCSKECKRTDRVTRASCGRCGVEFIKNKGGQRYCSPECAEGTHRDRYLARYGITQADYDQMLEAQEGVCMICSNPSPPTRSGKARRLAVDHDHDTGAVRGLLCTDCNTALGMLKDDPARLEAAIRYLNDNSPSD